MTWTEYEEFKDPVDMFFLLIWIGLSFMAGFMVGSYIVEVVG
jgi:hypothetical protein